MPVKRNGSKGPIKARKRPTRDEEVHRLLQLIRGDKHSTVARRAGISPSTVSNWRKGPKYGGTRFPQFWTMRRVAKAYGFEYRLVETE